jgi:hypothetical protein
LTKKTTISLQDDIAVFGQEAAKKFHGGNFSAYVTWLISSHKEKFDRYDSINEPMKPEIKK